MVTNCDGFDPDPPESGYCVHGVYVGGCGFDLMCMACELDVPPLTADEQHAINRRRHHSKLYALESVCASIMEKRATLPVQLSPVLIWSILEESVDDDRYRGSILWCVEHDDWPPAVPHPDDALTFDEVEAAGLDGTLREMA